jgi:hypothetical protein
MYDHLMMVEAGDGEWEGLGENAARDGGFKRYKSSLSRMIRRIWNARLQWLRIWLLDSCPLG